MNESITILDKTFVKYILSDEIDVAIKRVADRINEDYKDESPIILVTLNGAVVFGVDVLKQLTMPCRISCVKVSSYSGTQSTQVMKDLIGLNEDVRGQRVLIVEDIVDTGKTYQHLYDMLTEAGAREVRIATMMHKPEAYQGNLPIHYVGFEIPNRFVVGRGLDYDGYGRNLTDIYQLKTEL